MLSSAMGRGGEVGNGGDLGGLFSREKDFPLSFIRSLLATAEHA